MLREGGDESGSDRLDWTDVGIGKYTKSNKNEQENTSDNQSVNPQHVSKATHPTLETSSAAKLSEEEKAELLRKYDSARARIRKDKEFRKT